MNEIERAIKEFETDNAVLGGWAPEVVERNSLAVAALREKAERDKGCEYCHSRFGIATHHITDSGMKAGTNKNVNFCPMCGKRLEVEP